MEALEEGDAIDLEPDLEDTVAATGTETTRSKPFVTIDGKDIHKASVLHFFSDPFTLAAGPTSFDQLKHVGGFQQFETAHAS